MFRGDVMYGHTGSVPKYTTNNDLILAPIACVVLVILALIYGVQSMAKKQAEGYGSV